MRQKKVAAFTRQCPQAETDSADMTASSQRVSSLQRQLTNELLCKQNVQKHPSCTVHSKMRAQHGSAVCVQIMYDMHVIQNCIPWHDHAMCKEISKKTSFVPFAVKLVVCASFKGDAHCAKKCAVAYIPPSEDVLVVQNNHLPYHPWMISCMQKAMPSKRLASHIIH